MVSFVTFLPLATFGALILAWLYVAWLTVAFTTSEWWLSGCVGLHWFPLYSMWEKVCVSGCTLSLYCWGAFLLSRLPRLMSMILLVPVSCFTMRRLPASESSLVLLAARDQSRAPTAFLSMFI